jgi:site-specific DNA-cytosine methylase
VDNVTIYTISLFSGVGMLDEGLHAGLGFMGIRSRTVMYAEREAYPVSVLEARMEEGSLPSAPIWFGDLCELDASQFHGVVDCIAAGFPCQDLSLAGKRAGLDGKRSGLFFDILDIAHACGAWFLFLENVAGIATATASVVDEAEGDLEERAAARVVGELADRGWNAEWITLSASEVGASHGRARWFCIAWRQKLDDSNCPGTKWAGRTQFGVDAGREKVGHTGLQQQHLQQRQDGAEHSGASGNLADAERKSGKRPGNTGELARARQWYTANPAKAKKNVFRFLTNWLARKQENGGQAGRGYPGRGESGATVKPARPPSPAKVREEAVFRLVDQLTEKAADPDGFRRVLSVARDKYGDMGNNAQGQDVLAEALDILETRKSMGAKP